jgi:hypothetical protein
MERENMFIEIPKIMFCVLLCDHRRLVITLLLLLSDFTLSRDNYIEIFYFVPLNFHMFDNSGGQERNSLFYIHYMTNYKEKSHVNFTVLCISIKFQFQEYCHFLPYHILPFRKFVFAFNLKQIFNDM